MPFNRDQMAQWYADQHLKTDPGILGVYYLPANASDREIRFVEINELIGDRNDDSLQPIDFGVDMGTLMAHKLLVLDVTPDQWQRIENDQLALPSGWSLTDAREFRAPAHN